MIIEGTGDSAFWAPVLWALLKYTGAFMLLLAIVAAGNSWRTKGKGHDR